MTERARRRNTRATSETPATSATREAPPIWPAEIRAAIASEERTDAELVAWRHEGLRLILLWSDGTKSRLVRANVELQTPNLEQKE